MLIPSKRIFLQSRDSMVSIFTNMLNINNNTPLPTNQIYHKNLNIPTSFSNSKQFQGKDNYKSQSLSSLFQKKLNTDKFIYSQNSLQNGTHASNKFIIFFKMHKYQASSIYTYGNILHFEKFK